MNEYWKKNEYTEKTNHIMSDHKIITFFHVPCTFHMGSNQQLYYLYHFNSFILTLFEHIFSFGVASFVFLSYLYMSFFFDLIQTFLLFHILRYEICLYIMFFVLSYLKTFRFVFGLFCICIELYVPDAG